MTISEQRNISDARAPERAFFALVGEALYGAQWQSEIARALSVSDRTVRYWIAGRRMPRGIWNDILALLDAKDREFTRIASDLRMMLIGLDD